MTRNTTVNAFLVLTFLFSVILSAQHNDECRIMNI